MASLRRGSSLPSTRIALAALFVVVCARGVAAGGEAPQPDLTPLLDRLGRVAWLYADTALSFSCRETITVDGRSPHRYDYIYTHDEDGRFRDYRTRAGRRSGSEVDMGRERLPRWFGQAYSWVFIFRADRRERFRFTLGDGGEVLGRPALRLDFEPVAPIEKSVNDWAGTAFVDRDTSQILRVEAWTPGDFLTHGRFERARQETLAEPRYFTFETIVTDFESMKNGLRFPSEVQIDQRRYRVPGHRGRQFDSMPVYQVRQTYTEYRFFSVRTADQISAMISESRVPTAALPTPDDEVPPGAAPPGAPPPR